MDEVYSFLSKYINSQLKNYKFYSENKLNNIIDEYYDEYKKYLDKLNNKDDALNETLYSFNKKYLVKKDYKKSTFALLISLFYFIIESLKAFLGLFSFDLSLVFGVIDPILLIISIAFLIFLVVTYKKRTKVDFIIFGFLFLSIIIINIQCFGYFYRPTTGDYYYKLRYMFPGVLFSELYWLTSIESNLYELRHTTILFDSTFIISFLCLITSSIFYLKKRRKYARNND